MIATARQRSKWNRSYQWAVIKIKLLFLTFLFVNNCLVSKVPNFMKLCRGKNSFYPPNKTSHKVWWINNVILWRKQHVRALTFLLTSLVFLQCCVNTIRIIHIEYWFCYEHWYYAYLKANKVLSQKTGLRVNAQHISSIFPLFICNYSIRNTCLKDILSDARCSPSLIAQHYPRSHEQIKTKFYDG